LRVLNRFFLQALGWFIFTTILLLFPGQKFPKKGFFLKVPWFDKWVHIGLFAIMALLVGRWLLKKKNSLERQKQYLLLCGLACLAYGIIMEFIQKYFVPLRSFDMGDILADGAGSLLGVFFAGKLYIKK
jgi:VanZ family protein